MGKVVFSSWQRFIRDHRGDPPEKQADLSEFNLPESFNDKELKAIIGWDGVLVMDPNLDMVKAMKEYFQRVQEESCGRCIPCRVGTGMVAQRLERIDRGEGSEEDLQALEKWCNLIKDTSLCELGQTSPVPLLDAMEYYADNFQDKLSREEPVVSDNGFDFHSVLTAPCLHACPAHVNIPQYVGCVKDSNFEDALATIREKTMLAGVLGRVCVHPCEENCRRNQLEEPISVRNIKRFAYDFETPGKKEAAVKDIAPAQEKKESVAIVGSGPAGLNAAYHLALKGYQVTIYEALPVAGGMLAVGIPSYRLPREVLNEEIELVKRTGVEIKLNQRIGRDITLDELQNRYNAVFIAAGMHESTTMGVEGEDAGYQGFLPGVQYLRDLSLGNPLGIGEKIAVVGGGNVAMDCARSVLRLGVKEVHLLYRRSRAEMPAHEAEVEEAEEEGVQFHLLTNPSKLIAESGKVVGLECIKMRLGEPDSSGRRRPEPIEGSEYRLDVDTVIPAIGQVGEFDFVSASSGVKVSDRGRIEADPITLETAQPGVFAGGDAQLGPWTVIGAVAAGTRAAKYIDQYLQEGKVTPDEEDSMEQLLEGLGVYDPDEVPESPAGLKRRNSCIVDVSERIKGFNQVDLGLANQASVEEAERCLRCYRLLLAVT